MFIFAIVILCLSTFVRGLTIFYLWNIYAVEAGAPIISIPVGIGFGLIALSCHPVKKPEDEKEDAKLFEAFAFQTFCLFILAVLGHAFSFFI